MLFNSFAFIFFFFPVVLGVSLKLKGPWLIRWLTLSSLVFYSFAGHSWFVIPMLITTTLDYFLALLMESHSANQGRRKMFLGLSLCGNLGLLFFFKYAGLFTIQHPLLHLGLPAGISFYTFQTLSYIIDVYRKDCPAEKSFWTFACFVSFFPHLVAGPLTRHNQLIPQLNQIEKLGTSPRWAQGVFLFAVGLAKKVLIADRIGNLIDPQLLHMDHLQFLSAWLALLGYALQIYFDFSGYSDMAIGLGRLFGIELPQNFNSPYQAMNPSDFWQRWHITLSRWLRDYLYITLGGNRCSPFRRNVNLLITMGLGGFWHGANWTFIAWGLYHGFLLIIYHNAKDLWDRWPQVIQRTITFVAVCLGWVFFRAPNFKSAAIWFEKLFSVPSGEEMVSLLSLGVFVLLGLFIVNFYKNPYFERGWGNFGKIQQMVLGLTSLMALIFMNHSSKFLYYQF